MLKKNNTITIKVEHQLLIHKCSLFEISSSKFIFYHIQYTFKARMFF